MNNNMQIPTFSLRRRKNAIKYLLHFVSTITNQKLFIRFSILKLFKIFNLFIHFFLDFLFYLKTL